MGDLAALVASKLRDIPDFPQPGIVFKDFTPLLADGKAFGALVSDVADRYTVDISGGVSRLTVVEVG